MYLSRSKNARFENGIFFSAKNAINFKICHFYPKWHIKMPPGNAVSWCEMKAVIVFMPQKNVERINIPLLISSVKHFE